MPCKTDPALEIVVAATTALLDWFNPDSVCPAVVGTTDNVRFFAGDGAPLSAWDGHSSGRQGCKEPLVWVRLMRRFRTRQFPNETISTDCDLPRVAAVEIGVGWCAIVAEKPKWDEYAVEAAKSADTSWRLEEALCMASGLLKAGPEQRHVGTGTLVPYGPEGGVIAWSGVLYASY